MGSERKCAHGHGGRERGERESGVEREGERERGREGGGRAGPEYTPQYHGNTTIAKQQNTFQAYL